MTSLGTAGIVFLASEPGMGRRRLVSRVAEVEQSNDVHVTRLSLGSETTGIAVNRIVVACREIASKARQGNAELLCIDSLPVLDENDVTRVSRALRRLVVAGGTCLVVTDIENEMLVEAIPESACYRAYILLDADGTQGVLQSVTGGIPRLMRGYTLGQAAGVADPSRSVAYLDSLADLVSISLRDSLAHEERVLRAAMILLGSGSYKDLESVVGPVDREMLALLARDAPLFGVDLVGERFACVGLGPTEALVACLPRMLGEWLGNIAFRAADILMRRGLWARATAMANAYLTGQDAALFVSRWGIEALQVGGTDLATRASEVPDVDERPLRPVRLALSAIEDARPSFASLPLVELSERGLGRIVGAQRARLICLCRKALRDCSLAKGVSLVPDHPDQMSLELLVHLAAIGFMVEGEMTSAFHMLLVHRDREGGTLSSELLRGDFWLARALVGDVGATVLDEPHNGSGEFFGRARMRSFHLMAEAIDACVSAIDNDSELVECESISNRADLLGDTLTQAIAVCTSALGDLRRKYWARAKVRVDLVRTLGVRAGATVIVEFAELLGCVAEIGAGEDIAEQIASRSRRRDTKLRYSWRFAAEVAACRVEGEERQIEPLDVRGACPPDERWALTALCRGIDGFSEQMLALMPESWRKVVGKERLAEVVVLSEARQAKLQPAPAPKPVTPKRPIRICVLGGVTVQVEGQFASDRKLRTRRAKSFLAYMASTRGHLARRHEVMEVVWPESDYEAGLSRIYQSTSAVRAVVKAAESDLDPFVLNKKDGTISLNDEYVTCDVDEYRDLVMRVIAAGGNDEEVIRLAAQAADLYAGDLYVPSTDTTGTMEARRRELRDMHADMMVEAAMAAMRLGRSRMAARYADSAMLADGMREDAMEALIRAYDACGRRPEAHVKYVSFIRQMADREGRPPSIGLRKLAESLWGPDAGLNRRGHAS